MRNEKNKIFINKYKVAIIQYMFQECKVYNHFFEDFSKKISRIKSENCCHFNLNLFIIIPIQEKLNILYLLIVKIIQIIK